ncbi:MAG TPA: AbrB/MazE/SpoVT family DNA-binding domain-containing protein [Gemmataceae bacterium]|nr:AbrB/MazE/SpoVT family DNA-binding domain-containing protein [Gemmataceae bacterium]
MNTTQLTPLEPGNRIQLPADWADALGLRGLVTLDRTSNGILIRPCPAVTWDDIFATKLPMGSPVSTADIGEVSTDDLLF